jgi:hypothetical protein
MRTLFGYEQFSSRGSSADTETAGLRQALSSIVGLAVVIVGLTTSTAAAATVPPGPAVSSGAATTAAPPTAHETPVTSSASATTPESTTPKLHAAADDDDDLSPSATQPDFTVVNLPTTLRLPKNKLAFRVTHRFTRPLGQGSFGSSLGDLFGLDSGAQIGLEVRFAPIRGAQVGIYRTSDKTIDFFGSYNLRAASDHLPVSVSAIASVEGTNNFKDTYSPSLGAVLSADLGHRGAVYLVPTWVGNSNPLTSSLVTHTNTVYLGIGARVRISKGAYVVAELAPRLAGYKGGDASLQGTSKYVEGHTQASFGIEKQVGGHVFQLNFSNAFQTTTPAGLARGAAAGSTNWYLGFNISRKFY